MYKGSSDIPRKGAMGEAFPASGHDDPESCEQGAYLFQPDGEKDAYYVDPMTDLVFAWLGRCEILVLALCLPRLADPFVDRHHHRHAGRGDYLWPLMQSQVIYERANESRLSHGTRLGGSHFVFEKSIAHCGGRSYIDL
jgi:hypothetical protein